MREQYKNYWSEEDIAQDYDNFKHDWVYNEETGYWDHKTGIEMRVVTFERRMVEERGLSEWQEARRAEGLSKDEIEYYERRLVNQIKFIFKKNYQPPKEETLEERVKALEELNASLIEYYRRSGISEEKLARIAERQARYREKMLKEGLAKDGR